MQVDLYPWSDSLEELGEVAARAEAAGFRNVWSAELHRSAFVPVSVMADRTSRVGVGTGIAWAFTRSPMTTALAALDLDELSGGRFILGLGSGVKRLNEDWHGRAWERPVRRLADTVAIIRKVVASAHIGEPMEYPGEVESIRIMGYQRPMEPVRRRIPIYLAAVGEQMTRLAGEVADGWLGHELGSPAYVKERILPEIETGLARGGRQRGDIDLVASGCCVVSPDGKDALRATAGLVAFYASVRTYTEFFEFHGFADEARRVQERFREGDVRGMIEAVPDEMVDAVTLSGTPDRAMEKLEAYQGLVDAVKLSPPTHFIETADVRKAQDSIIATFGK
jgi:probable F420-dependent oxidoreductase